MTRMTWAYFVSTESNATGAYKKILAHVGSDRISSIIESVGSDRGGEFQINGPFGALCRDRGIKQESTTANTPERDAVAERRLLSCSSRQLLQDFMHRHCNPTLTFPIRIGNEHRGCHRLLTL